jgi:predicted O-methyltransferase YrrM
LLPLAASTELAAVGLSNYGIGDDVLRFIAESVGPESRTLETGAGNSTLTFACRRARHIAITPSADEVRRIEDYAEEQGIDLTTVRFVAKPSEEYLPCSDHADLDLVLLDGKHAFPWPIIDWFYTADRLRRGGLMLLDDIQMRSVSVLVEFMRADPGWEFCQDFSGKTAMFRKAKDCVLDVAWHMQPWTVTAPAAAPKGLLRRAVAKLRRPVT